MSPKPGGLSNRPRLHVIYEHGADLRPFSTAQIRLIRPLTHPTVRAGLDVTFGRGYFGEPVDAVILDRLWRPFVDVDAAKRLVARVRAAGARLIHALDDNLLDLGLDRQGWGSRAEVAAFHYLVRAADGLLVSTEALRARLAGLNPNIAVVPNALDERLLDPRLVAPDMAALVPPRAADRLVIGYMGTYTHAADLALVLPALHALHARHPGRFELQLLGVLADPAGLPGLAELPLRVLTPSPAQMDYPRFLPWFACALGWDIGIAPLIDTPFTRTKSDIKLLDYGAMGAAGIFSQVPAYQASVRHAETGWLAANTSHGWEEALERLLTDRPLRDRLGQAAGAYVRGERTLARRGGDWVAGVERLLETPSPALLRSATPPPQAAEGTVSFPGRYLKFRGSRRAGSTTDSRLIPSPAGGGGVAERSKAGEGVRLAVLCEHGHGAEARPLASAHLRLIRPLRHAALAGRVEATWGRQFEPHNVDAVVLDRLWRPDVTLDQVERLIEAVRGVNARLIYAMDDNLLDLPAERGDWPTPDHLAIVHRLLAEADGVLVASAALAERLQPFNPNLAVLPNALDERLLGLNGPAPFATPFGQRPLVIGYMGTATHDADFALVLPALRAVCRRHAGRVVVELVGVIRREAARRALAAGLPLRFAAPRPGEAEYPLFMTWFTRRTAWDIAIAPLGDSAFRRCKTDIKLLDYCAIGAAGVYSRVPAYAGSVRDGETGLLVENHPEAWEDALERLIAHADLRLRLGDAARRYLYAERVLAVRAGDWPAAIGGLLDR